MTLPITGGAALALGVGFGAVFGVLLQRGGLTSYDVIVNQFRLKDFTVLKVMLTAIVVGGAGVLLLHESGHAHYHVKSADLLAVGAGAAIFGVGMVVLGYCPGTGVAAAASGSVHAAAGLAGMLTGGMLYALSYGWLKATIIPVGASGKLRLPEMTGIPDWVWLAVLALALAGITKVGRAPRLRQAPRGV